MELKAVSTRKVFGLIRGCISKNSFHTGISVLESVKFLSSFGESDFFRAVMFGYASRRIHHFCGFWRFANAYLNHYKKEEKYDFKSWLMPEVHVDKETNPSTVLQYSRGILLLFYSGKASARLVVALVVPSVKRI